MKKATLALVVFTLCAGTALAYTESDARQKWQDAYAGWQTATAEKKSASNSYDDAVLYFSSQSSRFTTNQFYLAANASMMDYNMMQWHLYLADQNGVSGDDMFNIGDSHLAAGNTSYNSGVEQFGKSLWDDSYNSFKDARSSYLSAFSFYNAAVQEYDSCRNHCIQAQILMNKYIP